MGVYQVGPVVELTDVIVESLYRLITVPCQVQVLCSQVGPRLECLRPLQATADRLLQQISLLRRLNLVPNPQ